MITKSIASSNVDVAFLVEESISSLGAGVMVGTPFLPGRDISQRKKLYSILLNWVNSEYLLTC